MASRALDRWNTVAQRALDELEGAHRAVGGRDRGRRYATLQVNHAYAILLSSQFQGFCRDLHTEAVAVIVGAIPSSVLQRIMQNQLIQGRKLDQGNPNPGNLGSDFGRLGMELWPRVRELHGGNAKGHTALETLNSWRNAIAHQDWKTNDPALKLSQVKAWRQACRRLAVDFDVAVGNHVRDLVGKEPW